MSPTNSEVPTASRCRRVATKVRNRPAETAGAGASIAGLLTALFVGDHLAAATAAAGALPAVWTFVKINGGIMGIKDKLLHDDALAASADVLEGAGVA